MKDLNYFIVQAQGSQQREFELDYADVIEVFEFHETRLVTEDGRGLIIEWSDLGYFQGYKVIYETAQMGEGEFVQNKIEQIISTLRSLTLKGDCVDGETMQYILERVGMQDQMLRQLMLSQPFDEVEYVWEERINM